MEQPDQPDITDLFYNHLIITGFSSALSQCLLVFLGPFQKYILALIFTSAVYRGTNAFLLLFYEKDTTPFHSTVKNLLVHLARHCRKSSHWSSYLYNDLQVICEGRFLRHSFYKNSWIVQFLDILYCIILYLIVPEYNWLDHGIQTAPAPSPSFLVF